MKRVIVAVDGYSSSGKIAKRLASVVGYNYIDTGAKYQASLWLDNGNTTIEKQDKWLLEKFYERTR